MIKKTLKRIGIAILVYVFLCLITPFNKILRNRSIKNQINYLSNILDRGYDDEMQRRIPEGKLFSNALLALSTIEYCERNGKAHEKHAKVVDNCIIRIQTKRALGIFNPNIEPKYGMFYNGWSNYVYSSYIKSSLFNYSRIKDNVTEQKRIIESRLKSTQNDSLRILDTYREANWPADNLIGITSLSDSTLKKEWIKTIFESAKHPSGLIHHSGAYDSIIRGSSSAMITFCLNKSGYDYINNYNKEFKNKFIDEYLGIQLVQEHEDGSNSMDADSGPVIFGYGASATIMNIKTQASLKETKSKITWAAMNTIALPINIFKKKYYILKQEPMLDLFMLWGSTEL